MSSPKRSPDSDSDTESSTSQESPPMRERIELRENESNLPLDLEDEVFVTIPSPRIVFPNTPAGHFPELDSGPGSSSGYRPGSSGTGSSGGVRLTSSSPGSSRGNDLFTADELCPNLTTEMVKEMVYFSLKNLRAKNRFRINPDDVWRNPDARVISLLTAKLIVQNAVSDRDNQIKKVFNEALKFKLKELLEDFNKFSKDQVERMGDSSAPNPSYLL